MKAMAVDDPDIQPYLDISHDSEKTNNKENENNNEVNINILFWGTCSLTRVYRIRLPCPKEILESLWRKKMKTMILVGVVFKIESYYFLDVPAAARSVRYDKSLGVLCQKFVMLFLISAVSCIKTL